MTKESAPPEPLIVAEFGATAQGRKGRLGPDDVAALLLFLAPDDARLMAGHDHLVDASWR